MHIQSSFSRFLHLNQSLLLGLSLFLLCMGTSSVYADYTSLDFDAQALPKKAKFKGKLITGFKWKDKKGINHALFSEIQKNGNWYIYVYHYRKGKKGLQLLRRVRDRSECGEIDFVGGLVRESLHLSDLNHNQIGEVSFVYKLGCGDSGADQAKLLVLEDGKKWIIRGTPHFEDRRMNLIEKGKQKIDPAFFKAPSVFLDFAKKQWDKHTPVIFEKD